MWSWIVAEAKRIVTVRIRKAESGEAVGQIGGSLRDFLSLFPEKRQ